MKKLPRPPHAAGATLASISRSAAGFALGVDEGFGLDAAMKQAEAVEDGAHLDRDGRAVDGTLPDGSLGFQDDDSNITGPNPGADRTRS